MGAGLLALPVFGEIPFEACGHRLAHWPASTHGKQCPAWAGLSGPTGHPGPLGALNRLTTPHVNITPTGVDGVLETSPAAGPGPGQVSPGRWQLPALSGPSASATPSPAPVHCFLDSGVRRKDSVGRAAQSGAYVDPTLASRFRHSNPGIVSMMAQVYLTSFPSDLSHLSKPVDPHCGV